MSTKSSDRTAKEIAETHGVQVPEEPTGQLAAFLPLLHKLKGAEYERISEIVSLLQQSLLTATAKDEASQHEHANPILRDTAKALQSMSYNMTADNLRRLQPWRATEEVCKAQRECFESQRLEQFKDTFIGRVRDKDVTPDDILTGMYIFFADDSAMHFFRGLIATTQPGFARVQSHNFFIASLCPTILLQQHGKVLEKLRWPLFPPQFDNYNNRLLNDCEHPSGGDAHALPPVYRHLRHDEISGEAYFAPVSQAVDGTWGTDLTMVEDAVAALQRASTSTDAKLTAVARGLTALHRVRETIAPGYFGAGRGGGRGGRGILPTRGGRSTRGGQRAGIPYGGGNRDDNGEAFDTPGTKLPGNGKGR